MAANRKTTKKPRVFISHSHRDRHIATQLQRILEKNHGETYLDQDQIQAGDVLPDRLIKGIKWCDICLLIWSGAAATSTWVNREWDTAYKLEKKFIPYCIDSTPLPSKLEDRVQVDAEDQKHGHAGLLKAVFGKAFEPESPYDFFPGWWDADVHMPGLHDLGKATYELELRGNGQISGLVGMTGSGLVGQLAQSEGLLHLATIAVPIQGKWSYDEGAQILALEIVSELMGQAQSDTVRIRATGHEADAIRGQDLGGREYTLRRRSRPSDIMDLRQIIETKGKEGLEMWKRLQASPGTRQTVFEAMKLGIIIQVLEGGETGKLYKLVIEHVEHHITPSEAYRDEHGRTRRDYTVKSLGGEGSHTEKGSAYRTEVGKWDLV